MKCEICESEINVNYGDTNKVFCKKCNDSRKGINPIFEMSKKQKPTTSENSIIESNKYNGPLNATKILANAFFLFGALCFLAGLILSFNFLPGPPGYGFKWNIVAYTTSIIWFMAGMAISGLFIAIGHVVTLLDQIVENTSNKP